MCGIAGIIAKKNDDLVHNLHDMVKALSHRGPDAYGTYRDRNVFFGHSRLSIIDLLPRSNQPMSDTEINFTIIFNGEIYNFFEVKEEMGNLYNFQTQSDTEVLLAGYIIYGKKILEKINGCFSFAIYDKTKREVFIARDRLGIKPLYYHLSSDFFIFSSEIRAIISTNLVSKKIDNLGLNQLIKYQSSIAPNTILDDVKMLMPGSYMTFNISEFNSENKKYWSMNFQNDYKNIIQNDIKERVHNKVFSAIKRRMISDVEVAAFLSGGIDSSIIVACMAKLSPAKPINTFSLVHENNEFDESEYSDEIAKMYKTNHYKVKINDDDLLVELFDALKSYDSPSADGLNSYIVSKKISDIGIKVALSGLGGDELFGGYHTFKYWYHFKKWTDRDYGLSNKIRPILKYVADIENIKLYKIMSLLQLKIKNSNNVNQVLRNVSGRYGELILNTNIEQLYNQVDNKYDSFNNYLYSDYSVSEINRYTTNVLLKDTDQMSMANGLEVRVPFFDHELVEYLLSVPDESKKLKFPKQLLVEAFESYIPTKIYKRKKQGFVIPVYNWMQKELFEFSSTQIEKICDYKYFNADVVRFLWKCFIENKKYGSVVWSLIIFNNWLENNINNTT